VSGAGTLINVGDRVDMIVGLTGESFPVITIDPETDVITPVAGLNNTSVKLLLQNMQVVGTLLPPPPAPAEGTTTEGTTAPPTTTLTGQQEIVIVAGTPQQVEVICSPR
jgi:hypothetical protein